MTEEEAVYLKLIDFDYFFEEAREYVKWEPVGPSIMNILAREMCHYCREHPMIRDFRIQDGEHTISVELLVDAFPHPIEFVLNVSYS